MYGWHSTGAQALTLRSESAKCALRSRCSDTDSIPVVDGCAARVASAPGRVAWIFPFNFFLVEEFALLADSIESLVEAGDNLQITVTGDDGGDAFLFGGFSFPLREDPRNEAEPPEAAADPIDPIEESIGQAMTFLESVAAAFDDAVDDAVNPPPFAFEFPALEGITA